MTGLLPTARWWLAVILLAAAGLPCLVHLWALLEIVIALPEVMDIHSGRLRDEAMTAWTLVAAPPVLVYPLVWLCGTAIAVVLRLRAAENGSRAVGVAVVLSLYALAIGIFAGRTVALLIG